MNIISEEKKGANMLLTTQERNRFIAYLTQQVETSKSIMRQMEKLELGAAGQEMIKREKRKTMACLVIIADLESVEEG